jgi:hypothetical protein
MLNPKTTSTTFVISPDISDFMSVNPLSGYPLMHMHTRSENIVDNQKHINS